MMNRISTQKLRKLEIINLCDGSRLGYADNFEFDSDDARILALVITGSNGIFGIGKCDDLVIPWCSIVTFGEDTILVKLNKNEISACSCPHQDRFSTVK